MQHSVTSSKQCQAYIIKRYNVGAKRCTMSNVCFLLVVLIPHFCGVLTYNEKPEGNNPSVYSIFQRTNGNLNRIEPYNINQQNGAIATYARFPETFQGHISPQQSAYNKLNVSPIETTSGQNLGHILYAGRQPFNKPEQMLDHHFLTRPMSVISTPHGSHYLPHILGSQQRPTYFEHDKESYFYRPVPASQIGHEKPRIAVFAENIYINSGNPQTYGNKFDPRIGIQNGAKQEIFSAKLSLLKRLIMSIFPEKMDSKFDLPLFESVKPHYQNILHELEKPSPLSLMNNLKLQNNKFPNMLHHHTTEKGTKSEVDFHPLLNSSEYTQQTTGSNNVTGTQTGRNEKHENETSAVEISTDTKGVTGNHDLNAVMISVEGINNETED